MLNVKDSVCAVDNATNGFDLISCTSWNFLRTLVTGTPSTSTPKRVVFGEDGAILVGGTDRGFVSVFDVAGGHEVARLSHGDVDMVQTVTVRKVLGHTRLALTTEQRPSRRESFKIILTSSLVGPRAASRIRSSYGVAISSGGL